MIITHKFDELPEGSDVWTGGTQFANRYLRKGEVVEVEHVYRYGKSQPVTLMTREQFNTWQESIVLAA